MCRNANPAPTAPPAASASSQGFTQSGPDNSAAIWVALFQKITPVGWRPFVEPALRPDLLLLFYLSSQSLAASPKIPTSAGRCCGSKQNKSSDWPWHGHGSSGYAGLRAEQGRRDSPLRFALLSWMGGGGVQLIMSMESV